MIAVLSVELSSAALQSRPASPQLKTLNNIRLADQDCNQPGVLDQSCIENAYSALPANGGEIRLTPGVYNVSGETLIDLTAKPKPFSLVGSPGAILNVTGTSNGLHVKGRVGATATFFDIRNLTIRSAGAASALLYLDGVAHFKIDGVSLQGSGKAATCLRITGSQQGEIAGGELTNCVTLALVEGSGPVHSNGLDWHGMTFVGASSTKAGLLLSTDAADDLHFHGNHLTGVPSGETELAEISCSGIGQCELSGNHFEPTGGRNNSLQIRSGAVLVHGNSFYGNRGTIDIDVIAGTAKVIDNVIDAKIMVGAQSKDSIFYGNTITGDADDSGTRTRWCHNIVLNGSIPATCDDYEAIRVTAARSNSAGDIATFKPNARIGGDWGITVLGAGNGKDVYLKLNDITLSGNTSTPQLAIKSGLGGKTWATFTDQGLSVPQVRSGSASNTDLAGQIQLSSGAGSYRFSGNYRSAPICTCGDRTAANACKVNASTTELVLSGTGSDVINYICIARN